MAKLIMAIGLPGSGKSTWAADRKLKDMETVVVVNKDRIRRELESKGWVWSREAEADVIKQRDKLITEALLSDKIVISDDTNLAPKHQNVLKALANKHRATFETRDFRDVDIATCIERDGRREGKAKVGRAVIVKMAKDYLHYIEPTRKITPYVPDVMKPKAILVDLDGTLAIHNGRSPYDTAKCGEDLLNQPVFDIIHTFGRGLPPVAIVYCSGREDIFREETQAWLDGHGCPAGPLFMRAGGDTRNDAIVKNELFDAHIRETYFVQFVLDDRDRVVKMWRELGLTCLQVAYGDF